MEKRVGEISQSSSEVFPLTCGRKLRFLLLRLLDGFDPLRDDIEGLFVGHASRNGRHLFRSADGFHATVEEGFCEITGGDEFSFLNSQVVSDYSVNDALFFKRGGEAGIPAGTGSSGAMAGGAIDIEIRANPCCKRGAFVIGATGLRSLFNLLFGQGLVEDFLGAPLMKLIAIQLMELWSEDEPGVGGMAEVTKTARRIGPGLLT